MIRGSLTGAGEREAGRRVQGGRTILGMTIDVIDVIDGGKASTDRLYSGMCTGL